MATGSDSNLFPHLDIQLNPGSIDELIKVVQAVGPSWLSVNLKFEVFSDGITNNLIRASISSKPEESLLIRIYGKNTEKIINRANELKLLTVLEKSNLGPKVYATFSNGIVYQFFPGRILTQDKFYSEHIYSLVAHEMAMLHRQIENCSGFFQITQPVIWKKIESFLNHSAENISARPSSNKQVFRYNGCVDYELGIPSKSELLIELSWLRKAVEKLDSPLVLCHNDLLLANILYDEDTRTVRLIDFEYAGPNYQAYDVANHFNEYAFGADNFDASLYPAEDFQSKWLHCYLKSFLNHDDDVSEGVVINMLNEIKWFRLVSHLFCGTWALFQIAHSALAFDFHGYAHCRLREYFKLKNGCIY